MISLLLRSEAGNAASASASASVDVAADVIVDPAVARGQRRPLTTSGLAMGMRAEGNATAVQYLPRVERHVVWLVSGGRRALQLVGGGRSLFRSVVRGEWSRFALDNFGG
jgi:hypothetical protein